MLGPARGTALYVGALMGPGVLLVPALAADAAGPASIIAWGVLLVLSAPLAITFAALGVRHPVAGGVSAYVQAGFGSRAAAVTRAWFLTAVIIGAPAVALIGGYYVADLVGGGTPVAVAAACAMFGTVLVVNALGVEVSSGVQLGLSAVLVVIIAVAVAVALPGHAGDHWSPFAPHGWAAVGTAANILVWLFIGWEAMAQMAGDFRDPERDIPRAIAFAYTTVAVLYVGLAVATIGVGSTSKVPLADLLQTGLGEAGRQATAVLAVALTTGTMNVYVGGAARLTGLPSPRSLAAIGAPGFVVLAILAAGALTADDIVRATSACFISVYLLSLAAGVRILPGRLRSVALAALALTAVIAVFSAAFLLVPAAAAAVTLVAMTRRRVASPA